MGRNTLTRRRVLASLGVSGAAVAGGVGGLAMATEPAVAHTNATETEFDGNDLLFKWVETYNGEVQEDSGADAQSDPPGMTISLGDIKPGDSGVLGIEMTLQSDENTEDPSVDPYFALDLKETAENGINEPERTAGDQSSNVGELQDYVNVKIWYDTGTGGFELLGGSNLERDTGESLIDEDAQGTLADVAAALPDSTDLEDGEEDLRLETVNGGCLTTDDAVKIAFGWEFTNIDDPEINVTQTDSVVFDLIFRGEGGCGDNNT